MSRDECEAGVHLAGIQRFSSRNKTAHGFDLDPGQDHAGMTITDTIDKNYHHKKW
jgi:hypothetical protein